MDYDRSFALQQYNKAISCLHKRLSEGPQSEQITLMCCVLFICLEFLRGNIDGAISHLHSGVEIMAVWQARNRRLPHGEALLITSEPHSISDNLVQMFSRLAIQSMLCGRDPWAGTSNVPEIDLSTLTPVIFSSPQAARTSLGILMKISLQFLRESHELNIRSQPDGKHRVVVLTNTLDKWSLAFDLFLAGSSANRTRREIRAATNLRILNIVAKICLPSCVSGEESVFDQQTKGFSAIINLAATMSSHGSAGAGKPGDAPVTSTPADHPHGFTFEMGVVPPFYFVAIKCRVPSIRRAAISLLETTVPRGEGIWIASLYMAVAKRIIQIEEEDLEAVGHKDEIAGELLLPEQRRVLDAKILSRAKEDLMERVQKVTFVTRPHGIGGQWDEIDEEILW